MKRGILISCLAILPVFLVLTIGCYSLKGYSIATDISSFYVGNFKVAANNAPAAIHQTFQESLKDKIARESRLKYTETDPDLEFNGTVQSYHVTAVAPQPGERTSFNRLTISVNVEYTNNKNTKDQWTRNFSHFADFPTDENLFQIQDDLIKLIFDQILEDIFNQAFNNW